MRVMHCSKRVARVNRLRVHDHGIGGRDSCRLTEIVGKLWAQRGQHIASWRAVPVIGMILIVLSELSDVVRFGGSTNRRAVVRQRVSLGILRLSAL